MLDLVIELRNIAEAMGKSLSVTELKFLEQMAIGVVQDALRDFLVRYDARGVQKTVLAERTPGIEVRLSYRQETILRFIHSHVIERGYPPTVREIAEGLGLNSVGNIHRHLVKLESKGCLYRENGKPRAIELKQEA